MLVAHVFCRAEIKNYVHVASPVGEIQLKVYCNPSPYHENRFYASMVYPGPGKEEGR
jgi:hypothetical protein